MMYISTRADQLMQAVQKDLDIKLQQTLESIQQDFTANRDRMVSSLQNQFDSVLHILANSQPQKGKISYIHISYLLSSLLNNVCEFRLDFYNHNLYLDEIETELYWEADFITKHIQADFGYFEKLLKTTLIRVMDYEVQDMVVDFGAFYLSAMAFFWPALITSLPLKNYPNLFDEKVAILYGGFQDKSMHIATITPWEDVPCAIS